jgi:hypothetical protein
MNRKWMRLSLMPLLAMGLWVAGCSEQGGELLGPGEKRTALLREPTGQSYTPVKEDPKNDKSHDAWAVFPADQGGALYVAGHQLRIPKNAVDRETLWRIDIFHDGQVRAKLTALQQDAEGNFTVDVGPNGFRAPVELILSYRGAEGVTNDQALKVLWVKDASGSAESQPTLVDARGKKAKAYLSHFSEYVLAMP